MIFSKAPASAQTRPHDSDELQYLNLVRAVLDSRDIRPDRAGITAISALFAPPSLRFSLADNTLPLLTTKRTFLPTIIEELLWSVRGCTDAKQLSAKGVKMWDADSSRASLRSRGLGHRREGDLGPMYGFQWRHFGAKYENCETDYAGQGVDQLRECIRKIKEDPTDRRIILSAWNPAGAPDACSHQFCLSSPRSSFSYTPYGPPTMPHDVPVLRPPPSYL